MVRFNDHPPAHVHVYKAGASFKVDLTTFEASEVKGKVSGRELRKAEELVREHAHTFRKEWKEIHG
jgi:Domain of unknown function (DUF4160)